MSERRYFPVSGLIAFALAFFAVPATAGLITVSGGVNHTTPASNDIVGQVSGTLGGNLYLTGPASLTYTYLGKEAGWTNLFLALGDTSFGLMDTRTSSVGDSFSVTQSAPGLINFSFLVLNTGRFVANGANGLSPLVPNFFTQVIGDSIVRLMLDDGGAGPDNDLDDLVVELRATATSVPEPGTLALLSGGLLALLGIRRRRLA
ncbi:MAG: PEP-CTERM sorting domain-containing protein [Pseudomonadales bacterium]